jgi:dTDP-L-rhamnose 4-epimerase
VKILVTGGAGFIGQALIASLPADYDVVVVDALVPDVHGADAEFPPGLARRARCLRADVADVEAWRPAAVGVQAVVHLAALTGTAQSAHQVERYRRANLTGTIRLCQGLASLDHPPERLILASSRAVYGEGPYLDHVGGEVVFPRRRRQDAVGDGRWEPWLPGRGMLSPMAASEAMPTRPASVYAATKVAQERHCAAFASRHGAAAVTLRLQNVYGPGQHGTNPHAGVVAALARGVLTTRQVELFEDGDMTRDFIHVEDVVRAMRWAVEAVTPLPRILNVGTGRRTSLRSLVGMLAEAAGRPTVVGCSGRFRAGDVRHACADTAQWCRSFGAWQPLTLETSVPGYVEWLRDARPASACR